MASEARAGAMVFHWQGLCLALVAIAEFCETARAKGYPPAPQLRKRIAPEATRSDPTDDAPLPVKGKGAPTNKTKLKKKQAAEKPLSNVEKKKTAKKDTASKKKKKAEEPLAPKRVKRTHPTKATPSQKRATTKLKKKATGKPAKKRKR